MIFTEIVVTAPSEKIASVYRLQLSVLKKTSSSLQNTQLYCVADPIGCRIGSGGGTINAIDFLCINVNNFNPQKSKVLIIHSGGDSRRAPLYSLCGKAWTTINALVDGEVIANPLVLLIYEISKFCVQLPNGSLVVASSDVMLDICKVFITATYFQLLNNCYT